MKTIKTFEEFVNESTVNEAMSFTEIKDKYLNNPYGIGANRIEYIEGKNGNSRLIFRVGDKYYRDQIEKKLKDLGIPTKKMSKFTADKAFKYRYELTLFENEVIDEAKGGGWINTRVQRKGDKKVFTVYDFKNYGSYQELFVKADDGEEEEITLGKPHSKNDFLKNWKTNESEETVINENESLNEDLSMGLVILINAAIVNGLLIGQMAAAGGGGSFTPIEDLKNWWKKRKSDKALKSIIDKIKDDEDVIEFMKLTPSQQRGKFRSLIATKLTGDELEYLNKINRSHFQKESLNESGTIKIGNEISEDLKTFLTGTVIPKSRGYVKNERDAAALLLDIIKHRYNF